MSLGLTVVFAVLQLLGQSSGQTHRTTYGTLFAGVLPPARTPSAPSSDCRFYINAINTTTVTIQFSGGQTSQTIPALTTFIYTNEGCSNRVVGGPDGLIEEKGYRITADNPISVLVISEFEEDQMDSALLCPLEEGQDLYQFYTYTYQKDEPDATFGGCGSVTDVSNFFLLAAAEDNTTVTVQIPPDYTSSKTFTLKRFGTYTETKTVLQRNDSYTGYYITSDKPISVISGTLCADATTTSVESEGVAFSAIPELSEWEAGDYLSYELFTYGNFGVEQRDFYRVVIMASEDDTLVTIAGIDNTINRGTTVQYQFEDDFEKITCNKPCLVLQVSENRQAATGSTGVFQMQVQNIEEHGSATVFTNYRVGALVFYFVRIVTTNDQDFRDIVISQDIEEREPWECKDLIAGGRACTWLGQIQNDQVQGFVQSSNPNATFSVGVYWSSAADDGKGYGYNAGTYP